MNCTEAHLAIGAEPESLTPQLEQHLRECAACADYRREMLDLDAQIRRALTVDIAALKGAVAVRPNVRLVACAPEPSARGSWLGTLARQWALAASLLFAVGVVFVLWGALPQHSLAADVVAHVISEPLPANEQPISESVLEGVLRVANLRLDPADRQVLFAQTCFLRGRLVPHFVVRSGDAVVTVIVLPDEPLKAPERFSENGYSGVLLPNENRGSIAVLSRSKVDAEKEARELLSALHSQPAA